MIQKSKKLKKYNLFEKNFVKHASNNLKNS